MNILVLTSTYSRWKNDTEPKFVDYLCQSLAKCPQLTEWKDDLHRWIDSLLLSERALQ